MNSLAELLPRLALLGSLALPVALAGCGTGAVTTETSGSLAITGRVHGGVQPIAGATIQLFATGTGGNGSQAASLLTNPVVSAGNSYFTLTGDYHCPSSSSQVYLVARGGNPGFAGSVDNQALVLLSALGNCGDLAATTFIQVNEVSTVAAVYALAQFTTAYDHIGASATNTVGITNAFRDAHLLADTSTGMAPNLPPNLAIESGKLYALADAIVPCVNSDGGSACTPLFAAATPNGGPAPTDVLGALLNIVRNPSRNVGAVFNAISSTPPYPTSLTQAPNDWTMSLSVTGGGIAEPTAIGLDSLGDVWVANYGDGGTAGLVGYTPQGTPLSTAPFGAGLQIHASGLAVDKNDDVWVSSLDNQSNVGVGSVAKFHGVSSGSTGTLVRQIQDSSLFQPIQLAADPNGSGSVLAVNYNGGTVTFFNLDGTISKVLGANFPPRQRPVFPQSVISDNAGGAWVGDHGDNDVVHLLANGTMVRGAGCCADVSSVALDLNGDVWASNYSGVGTTTTVYTVSEVAPAGGILIYEETGGGLFSPARTVMDAGGDFWVLDYYGRISNASDGFTEIAASNPSYLAGSFLSPATSLGRDAQMNGAYDAAVDASGNLWMTAEFGNSLRMFFGIATPTAMPAKPIPQAP